MKSGGALGLLPDQVPSGKAIDSKFFNYKVSTSTLIHKLIMKYKCKVIFGYALRNERNGIKYDVYLSNAPTDLYNSNPEISVRAMNKMFEDFISLNPDKYLWVYKRFK